MDIQQQLRAENDTALAEQLLAAYEVKKAIEEIEKQAEKLETRRQLLATAVRLGPRLAPELHKVVEPCVEKLQVETELELFAFPSPVFNAACVRPEDGRLFLMFSSQLLEGFDEDELEFVVGHELGHHVFNHHAIPVGALLRGEAKIPPRLAMLAFNWSRYAEISADRTGLYCSGDLDAVARALFKLASGLRKSASHVVMDALLEQVEDIRAAGQSRAEDLPRADWFSTHPFSPLRLKAVQIFSESELLKKGGITRTELEEQLQDVMSIMEPGYLLDKTDEAKAMRRLLLAGGVLVAAASDGISDEEIEAIEDFLGPGVVSDKLSIEALREDLPARIEAVKSESAPSRRAQVVRDLCVIARADGSIDDEERGVITGIAKRLGLGPDLVCRALDGATDLD